MKVAEEGTDGATGRDRPRACCSSEKRAGKEAVAGVNRNPEQGRRCYITACSCRRRGKVGQELFVGRVPCNRSSERGEYRLDAIGVMVCGARVFGLR